MIKGERNKDISDMGEITKKLVHRRETKDISDISVLRWWKDNEGGELDIGGRYDKGKGSIKILSTQVGGASSWTCMVHLNAHFIYLLA